MHTSRITRSQTRSLVTQPSASISTLPASTSSSDEVNDLFNQTTPIPSPPPMSNNEHDAPPHMNTPAPEGSQALPPALDPNLQQAMAALFQAMSANLPAAPLPQILFLMGAKVSLNNV